jgi:hypothetical protein
MKPWHVTLVAGVVVGCGGEGNPKAGPQGPFEPVPEPATVIIIDAEVGSTFGSVTVHLLPKAYGLLGTVYYLAGHVDTGRTIRRRPRNTVSESETLKVQKV